MISALLVATHLAVSGWVYPANCCSDFDCAEIPKEKVVVEPEGYRVTLYPGDHHFIKVGMWFFIPHGDQKIRDSPDGKYHICISKPMVRRPWVTHVICFFRPPQLF